MFRWFSLRHWQLFIARLRCREQLALLLWPYLPPSLRHADDNAPLRQITTLVRRLESGNDEFFDDAGALSLWQVARDDHDVQQAVGALRTLSLQLEGDATAVGLAVASPARSGLQRLRKQMIADATYSEIDGWQQLPALLPLLSAMILCSGWFFNQIYLGQLGLSVGQHFGLSDYLAASMEGLIPAAAGVLFTLMSQWFMRGRVRLQSLQRLLGMQWRGMVVSALMLIGITIFAHYSMNDPRTQRVIISYVVVVSLTTLLVPWIVGFFKRPARMYLFTNFALVYVAILWFFAEIRYIDVLSEQPVRTEVTLISQPDKPLNWEVLSGNSLYLFLRNEQKEVVAVPVQQVLSVRYRKKPDPTVVEPASTSATTPASEPELNPELKPLPESEVKPAEKAPPQR